MRFGMSTACLFPDLFVEDAIDVIGGMGIKTIEVFFSCLEEYRTEFAAELKRRAHSRGIGVYSVHAFSLQFEPQLFTRHLRARREAEDIYRRVLEAGATLGAGVYVFHGPVNLKRYPHGCLDYDDIAARTDALADTAKEYGIALAWENVHHCWYERPEFARELLRRVRTDNLWFTLDVKQAAQAGFAPSDFLPDTAGRLKNVHLCDYARGAGGASPRLPFAGEMDHTAFKKALLDMGYDGGLMLEVYRNNYRDYAFLASNYSQVVQFYS